ARRRRRPCTPIDPAAARRRRPENHDGCAAIAKKAADDARLRRRRAALITLRKFSRAMYGRTSAEVRPPPATRAPRRGTSDLSVARRFLRPPGPDHPGDRQSARRDEHHQRKDLAECPAEGPL